MKLVRNSQINNTHTSVYQYIGNFRIKDHAQLLKCGQKCNYHFYFKFTVMFKLKTLINHSLCQQNQFLIKFVKFTFVNMFLQKKIHDYF